MQTLQTNHLGIEEINDADLLTIDGGNPLVRFALAIGAAAGAQILSDWDDFKAGLAGECPKSC